MTFGEMVALFATRAGLKKVRERAEVGAAFAAAGIYGLLNSTAFTPVAAASPKFVLWRTASGDTAGSYYVAARKPGGGGVLFRVRRDVVTSTDSLGVASEIYRSTTIDDIASAADGRIGAALFRSHTSQTGTWTTSSIGAATLGFSGTTMTVTNVVGAYSAPSTTTPNSTIVFDVNPDGAGRANVCFLSTGNGATAEITEVGTGNVLKTLSLARVGASSNVFVQTIELGRSEPTQISVKHTGTSGQPMTVLGAQWYWLSDPGVNMTTAKYNAYLYCINAGRPYSNNNGASDFAFREALSESDDWGGSLHGGQSVSIQTARLDAKAVNSSNPYQAGIDFVVYQESTISWASGGGDGSLFVRQWLTYSLDGTEDLQVSLSGDVLVRRAYDMMSTTYEGFTQVVEPFMADIIPGGDLPLGATGTVTQRNPTTGQWVTTSGPVHEGAFIRNAAGLYSKLYGGPLPDPPANDDEPAPIRITQMAWRQRRVFGQA